VTAVPIAIRDKIIANSQQFLEPGEQVQAAFAAQTFNQYWALLSWLIVLFKNSYRAVLVTDRRILVLGTGRWSMGTPKEVLRTLPRTTKIGPVSGLWATTTSLGEKLYVAKRFHKDIDTADSMATA
jgi:hypothetical protein